MRTLAQFIVLAAVAFGCASGPHWTRRLYAFSLPSETPALNAKTNIVALRRLSISPPYQSRSFTYKIAENSYEQDPYAGFAAPPERALAESIRASMRASGVFGMVLEPGSRLSPSVSAEVSVTKLYGDFRNISKPAGTMEIHFVLYEVNDGAPGRVILDKLCLHETPLAQKTPDALMVAWNTDLEWIMKDLTSDYSRVAVNSP